ncbi:hydrolase [Peptoniphilus sp. MSJ-1]|uniref:Hydrolase n=1 Tax=Peptoniphilus ovalis TaxID=2841503 RepID=A0ABS6FIS6_9FIRM|nr:hydrolase [Peptoniphilus ovalis]MBU5670075.1 hydrolase [Peptoniphilus ovalis]
MGNENLEKKKKFVPTIETNLRKRQVSVPEVTYRASGINFMGKRIKSLLFTNDIPIIVNNNAQGIMSVYPFTPQLKIISAIMEVASVPVFVGIGGGTTSGIRAVNIGLQAELMGAAGVVVNAPMTNENIKLISESLDVAVIASVITKYDDIEGKVEAGAKVLNIAGGKKTAELVKYARSIVGNEFPIIATGGHTDEHILETIEAGANTITYTPLSSAEIFSEVMDDYRIDMRNS